MAFAVNDRVKETSTTTGTGTFTLAGAVEGFETFSSAIGNSNTTYYAITNQGTPTEFEVGIGTVGAGTLSRDTIISSSNSDAAVNFSAGEKNVFCTLPASKAVLENDSGVASATTFSGSGAQLTNLNASNVASGTLPDARFPATLPAISGANLTNLDASDLASGTIPDARFPATLPAISGANLTNLDASDLASGTVPDARFPATLPAISGANLTSLNATNIASGTLASDRLPTVPTTKGGTGLTTIGSANQVLAVNGAGTALEYQTPTTGDITGVTAGTGLSGGGSSGDVTLNLDLNELTTSTADGDGDFFAVVDSVGAQKKLTKANIAISGFNNDAGYTTNTGTVTSVGVTAGSGLTGGGTVTTSGTINLDVGAGTGIDVAADAISVDVSDFMTNGSNNRVVTATGTDAMNAEANMTFDGTDLSISRYITHIGDTNCYIGFGTIDTFQVITGGIERLKVDDSNITASRNFVPGANDTYDLGASGNVWRNLYTGDLHLSNEAKEEGNAVDGTKGNWTIQEGAEDLYLLNNKSGKKYKFKLEEV